jgi:ribosome-associated toxin RatA of RatAB toxin-antitoxin module
MAPVGKRTEMINAPVETLWEVITDVERYPEFLKEVKSVKVEKVEGNRKTATYTVDIVKTIRYTLVLTEDKPSRVTWTMSKGEMMSKNDGSWELRDEGGGRCSALYTVDIKFGLLVPSSIVGMLTEVNLPKMLDAFKKRAESLSARKK